MRLIISCLLLIGLALAKPDTTKTDNKKEGYTTKYDNIDLEEILNNIRLLDKYFNCLIEKGKCTTDGKELKEIVPDALKTGCSKCNEKQKAGVEQVLRYLIEKKRDYFDELAKKYDPEGIYLKKYEAEAEKRGIKL
ncbi:ejaculatory bulb-specific protein 3 [Halyomorpha halys]|uniref:ejaculatory bulb-specific protein 3 n=1 Tax=Halyomorpha halys TaxID=286706 RepID=UPI0006D4FA0C|nr:ejaculatory bulb-specific protein 3 [Halyomorpha halys]